MAKKKIEVQAQLIGIEHFHESDYISLTDIVKHSSDEPRFVIQNWLKNIGTIKYLLEWEKIHNLNLNRV